MINSDIVSLRYDGTNVLVEDRYVSIALKYFSFNLTDMPRQEEFLN